MDVASYWQPMLELGRRLDIYVQTWLESRGGLTANLHDEAARGGGKARSKRHAGCAPLDLAQGSAAAPRYHANRAICGGFDNVRR
jgi:hypothetical protein